MTLQHAGSETGKDCSSTDERYSGSTSEGNWAGASQSTVPTRRGAVAADAAIATCEREISASQTRRVARVDDDGSIAEEAGRPLHRGEIKIEKTAATVSRSGKDGATDLGRMPTHVVWNGLVVMLPCLPARSPVWQVSGWVGSHGGISPRMYGSWWARVAVQLPFDGTG